MEVNLHFYLGQGDYGFGSKHPCPVNEIAGSIKVEEIVLIKCLIHVTVFELLPCHHFLAACIDPCQAVQADKLPMKSPHWIDAVLPTCIIKTVRGICVIFL